MRWAFSDMLVSRFMKMCSLRPIVGNLIGIALSFMGILSIHYYLGAKEMEPFVTIITYFLEAAIGIQIIKSASRSILLPVISMCIISIALTNLKSGQSLLHHPVLFFQVALVVSISGLAISAFTID